MDRLSADIILTEFSLMNSFLKLLIRRGECVFYLAIGIEHPDLLLV